MYELAEVMTLGWAGWHKHCRPLSGAGKLAARQAMGVDEQDPGGRECTVDGAAGFSVVS